MTDDNQNWEKSRGGIKRILNAASYSISGFQQAFCCEAAFRQLLVMLALLLPIALLADCSAVERALLIGVLLLSLIVELFNSAIEAVVDRISLDYHELSKQAKDMGSAAQFLALLVIGSTWTIILFT